MRDMLQEGEFSTPHFRRLVNKQNPQRANLQAGGSGRPAEIFGADTGANVSHTQSYAARAPMTIPVCYTAASARKSKYFFFEKKKQETFDSLRPRPCNARDPIKQKFFFKKELLPGLSLR